jgi:hypothetical protein
LRWGTYLAYAFSNEGTITTTATGGDRQYRGVNMKNARPLIVHAIWDGEARVWVATSDDVPGLATEAVSLDALMPKLKVMIPELLDANGYPDGDEIPFRVLGEINDIVCREAA